MRAISLWQPWATLIAIGAKKIETRGWRCNYTGPLAIHASKKIVKDFARSEPCIGMLHDAGISNTRDIPLGAIVCVCNVDTCTAIIGGASRGYLGNGKEVESPEWDFGDYSPARWAWMLSNVRKLVQPVPFKGRQKWFDVPDVLLEIANAPEGR